MKERQQLPEDLKVFTIQIEAHGRGSCIEAVELARALHIDLWGAKNAPAGWIARAQAIADERKVPVTFFVANEEYGTFVDVPGLGTYSHTSDIIAPAGVDFGASLAGKDVVSWEEFRQRRLAPLNKADGRLIWQFGENEELTRLYLDDSLQRGGYAAISTFHFGNPDFTNSEPFLKHYWQQIPFVGLQDAHGEESWWWLDQLEGFRTLFLATEPTWKGWLTALKNNWVVAVRHDRVSSGQTWMHGGPPEVLEFVRRREPQWRWWDNPSIQSPVVSLVAVRPDDKWEAARPERGRDHPRAMPLGLHDTGPAENAASGADRSGHRRPESHADLGVAQSQSGRLPGLLPLLPHGRARSRQAHRHSYSPHPGHRGGIQPQDRVHGVTNHRHAPAIPHHSHR